MEKKKYTRLTLSERVIIETLLKEKRSKSYIAEQLGRSGSTISNELNKWKGSQFYYSAHLADQYARYLNVTKRNKDKITLNNALKIQVYRGLLNRLSPELISGRLKIAYPDKPDMQISYESIYRYIYAHPQGKVNKKLIKLLLRKKTRRRSNKKRAGPRGKIKDAVSIENRPSAVENRNEAGHWEGDLINGARETGHLSTLVERCTRYTLIDRTDSKEVLEVTGALCGLFGQLPPSARLSLTLKSIKII